MENSGAGVGEGLSAGLSAGVEGSGLQSTGASQHATGGTHAFVMSHVGVHRLLALPPAARESWLLRPVASLRWDGYKTENIPVVVVFISWFL